MTWSDIFKSLILPKWISALISYLTLLFWENVTLLCVRYRLPSAFPKTSILLQLVVKRLIKVLDCLMLDNWIIFLHPFSLQASLLFSHIVLSPGYSFLFDLFPSSLNAHVITVKIHGSHFLCVLAVNVPFLSSSALHFLFPLSLHLGLSRQLPLQRHSCCEHEVCFPFVHLHHYTPLLKNSPFNMCIVTQ